MVKGGLEGRERRVKGEGGWVEGERGGGKVKGGGEEREEGER
jgi:hypothetical protein